MAKTIIGVLFKNKIVPSSGQARRLVAQGGVFVDDQRIRDPLWHVPRGKHTIRIGKTKTFEVEVDEPDIDFNDDGSTCLLLGGK